MEIKSITCNPHLELCLIADDMIYDLWGANNRRTLNLKFKPRHLGKIIQNLVIPQKGKRGN